MKHFYLILGLFSALFITSCTKEPVIDIPLPTPNDNAIVRTNITENTTWTANRVWQLSGRIVVTNGATLTIEPGTIIKGEPGIAANASSLVVARGAKLIAEGTEDAPIIFTSTADSINIEDIKVGVFSSPNLDNTKYGLWGGVIILGKAPISASNDTGDASQVQIEGIPTSDLNGLYGGNDPNDNSGILRYISIRHGGTNIGSGNEINGLTLGGVGSGTVIDNIEIVANQDDGVEFFGGTVNASNIVVWSVGDDAIDTDQGWSGTLDNFAIIAPQGHCFELDGPEGTLIASHTIKNGIVIASNGSWSSMDLINTDDNSRVFLENIYFTRINLGQKINRTTYDTGAVAFKELTLNVHNLSYYIDNQIPKGISKGNIPQISTHNLRWTWAYDEKSQVHIGEVSN
jgi:hypothetical protein